MQNNTTLNNMTQPNRECNIDYGTVFAIRLYTYIIISICSFIGNSIVILIVYRNKNLHTSTNYFLVSMSVSDILFPLFILLTYMYINGRFSRQSKFGGNLLCKLLPFSINVSYGVSIATLVVITIYRLSAVMFPMRARVQNKRKRFLFLVLTWVIPMAMNIVFFVYQEFNEQYQFCFWTLNSKQLRSWIIAQLSLFHFLPILIMLLLYPLIIIMLKLHRVPGNVITPFQTVIRRKRQNRLTMMFIVLTVVFLLCWGPFIIYWVLVVFSSNIDWCFSNYFFFVIFQALNPVIYFIFLSSFRQGFKNIFRFSRHRRTRPQTSADTFELNNTTQGLHNN